MKGKSTGNHRFSHEIWDFPVIFPLDQPIDVMIQTQASRKKVSSLLRGVPPPVLDRTSSTSPRVLLLHAAAAGKRFDYLGRMTGPEHSDQKSCGTLRAQKARVAWEVERRATSNNCYFRPNAVVLLVDLCIAMTH